MTALPTASQDLPSPEKSVNLIVDQMVKGTPCPIIKTDGKAFDAYLREAIGEPKKTFSSRDATALLRAMLAAREQKGFDFFGLVPRLSWIDQMEAAPACHALAGGIPTNDPRFKHRTFRLDWGTILETDRWRLTHRKSLLSRGHLILIQPKASFFRHVILPEMKDQIDARALYVLLDDCKLRFDRHGTPLDLSQQALYLQKRFTLESSKVPLFARTFSRTQSFTVKLPDAPAAKSQRVASPWTRHFG